MNGRLENEMKIIHNTKLNLQNRPKYMSLWLDNLLASDKTAATIREYIYKVNDFIMWMKEQGKDVEDDLFSVDLNDINSYFIKIRTTGNKNEIQQTSGAYRQSVWFALSSFFDYAVMTNIAKQNYIRLIAKPKIMDNQNTQKQKIYLTKDDFKLILRTIKTEEKSFFLKKRNLAIMLILMTTGMRKTALTSINIQDVDFINHKLTVIDKGNKIHEYVLNRETYYAIARWIQIRSTLHLKNENALFISKKHNRISTDVIDDMVNKYGTKALGKHLSPHKIRAGFCSIMYNETNDIEFVRRVVGHSNVRTTQRYIVTDENERQVASKIMDNLL